MTALFLHLRDQRFARYLLASVGALALDIGLFMALLALGMGAALASGIGYCGGIAAHWLLSSRTVFADSVAERGTARHLQKVLFVVSALLGLALTTGIVGAATAGGIDPRLGKLVAIGVSFLATWFLRSQIVFARGRDGQRG